MTAVLALLGRVPAAVWEALCAGLAVLLLVCSVQLGVTRLHLAGARADTATARQALAEQQRAAAVAAQRQEAESRARETAWSNAVQEQQRALESERQRSARFAADLRAARLDADSLREPIDTFAAGGGAAVDTIAACRDRAAALGDLLAEALHAGEACAGDGEAESAKLRAVLGSWPR